MGGGFDGHDGFFVGDLREAFLDDFGFSVSLSGRL